MSRFSSNQIKYDNMKSRILLGMKLNFHMAHNFGRNEDIFKCDKLQNKKSHQSQDVLKM